MNVTISNSAKKDLKSVPKHVEYKLHTWIDSVETFGMASTRKSSGWHDEPLKGERKGQRSVRLSKKYRAIYVEESREIVEIVEVTPHKY